ncbi:MAG: hypothetical protein IR153_03820 [Flavobacterium sp.]|nr:hypothetical protein [Flavobacterium sp.]
MKKIIPLILLFFSCQNSVIDKFAVDNYDQSNFSIYQRELFPFENLTITINDKYIYKYVGDSISYWRIRHYKLPIMANKIKIKSNIGERILLDTTFIDSLKKNKELIITTPFPKNYKDSVLPLNGFSGLNIDNSERYIYIKYY